MEKIKKLLLILLCLPMIGFGQEIIEEKEIPATNEDRSLNHESEFLIPTAFSPNDDGYNDEWKVTGKNSDKITEVKIFDRFGQLIFEDKKGNMSWNGNGANVGTYFYVIHTSEMIKGEKKHKGTISLIR